MSTTISMPADELMTRDPVCVSPEMPLAELARTFRDHEISGAPVIDSAGKVVGVVSMTDILRRCAEGTGQLPPAYLFETLAEQGEDEETSEVLPETDITVADIMTEDPITVSPATPLKVVAEMMAAQRVHRIIVVDPDNEPVGIITSLDLIGLCAGAA
jgi:CBS domain-containing protein